MDLELFKILSPFPFLASEQLHNSSKLPQNKTCVSCTKLECIDSTKYKNDFYRCYKHFDNILYSFAGEKIIFNGLVFLENAEIPSGRKQARQSYVFTKLKILKEISDLTIVIYQINKGIAENIREKFSIFHDVKTSYGLAFSNIESYIFKRAGHSFHEKLQSCEQEIIDLYDSLELGTSLLELIDVIVNPKAITQGTKKGMNFFRLFDKLKKLFLVTAKKRHLFIQINSSFQVKDGVFHDSLKLVPIILLDNAIKYSDLHNEISINFEEVSGKIKFNVTSFGDTIPKEERDQVFQKHFKGKNSEKYTDKGIGMGLFAAHMILEQHNGTIKYIADPPDAVKGKNIFEVIV